MAAKSIRKLRNIKAIPHLEQYAPVWLESERIIESEDSILFNVVFRHPQYNWVNRRYRYDAFNDVLYYKGQRTLTEEEAWAIQETPPYIEGERSDILNSYGG